ncbi:MAG: DUF4390 domain-containing protein [Deltaproteobacteria bacterium]|nr:DUF4390 domain-containing protein [Deltaproteobacteria bacterium]
MIKTKANYFLCALIFLLCALLVLLQTGSNLHASGKKQIEFAADHPPYLDEFVLSSENGQIRLSVETANPFDHEIKSLLLNGVSQNITLHTKAKVNKLNLFLINFNRTLCTKVHVHQIKYDNLKRVFVVSKNSEGETMETTSYKEALEWAASFRDITLLTADQLEENRSYQVETFCEIRKVRLPFHLEYLFFFLSAWDRKSNSYTIDIPERLISETLQR